MAEMRNIPGTPDWIKGGAKTTAPETPETAPTQTPSEEDEKNK